MQQESSVAKMVLLLLLLVDQQVIIMVWCIGDAIELKIASDKKTGEKQKVVFLSKINAAKLELLLFKLSRQNHTLQEGRLSHCA